jgi:hypothetical protein
LRRTCWTFSITVADRRALHEKDRRYEDAKFSIYRENMVTRWSVGVARPRVPRAGRGKIGRA